MFLSNGDKNVLTASITRLDGCSLSFGKGIWECCLVGSTL